MTFGLVVCASGENLRSGQPDGLRFMDDVSRVSIERNPILSTFSITSGRVPLLAFRVALRNLCLRS